jgi:hypothetical protein
MKLDGQGETVVQKNYMILCSDHISDNHCNHESVTGFNISRHIMDNALDFEHVNERIFKIRVKLKYYNLTLIITCALAGEKDVTKEEFYSYLGWVSVAVPNDDKKTALGDFNAKAGKKSYLYLHCGHSLHNETNYNGNRIVNFELGRDLSVTQKGYLNNDFHNITWR